jgi:peptidyl-prolyl cis-trans isomerase SurA
MNFKTNCNKMIVYILILWLFSFSFINCNRANRTVAEIGNEKITLGEYEKQFLKTLPSLDSAKAKTLDDRKQFLDLYINFRLKVKDARERGLLDNPDMQKEISDYKKNYSPTYLIDREVVEPEIKKLYERKKEEVRASHILINLSEKPTPRDSIAAYQRADTIIQKLKDGTDFGDLALQYSSDRTVKTNRGDLYYFTGGMTVEEFESAVFDLKVGEFTKKPIRTIFGLHIIKLTDRKPRFESIRASHILIQDKRDSTGAIVDSMGTYQKALDVYNKLKNGEDFTQLVTQYSEDPGSKNNGGDLGYFDRRRLAQPLDSALFNMKVGQVAGPIKTQYGWHIVKKTEEKPFESFDKQKENLKSEYKRTKKFKDDYQKFVDKLLTEYNYKIDDGGFQFLRSKFDTTKTVVDYNMDSLFQQTDKDRIVAKFDGGEIKVSDILNLLNVNRDYQRTPLTDVTIKTIINTSAESPMLNKKANDSKVEKDDEYIATLREYENGLLVFRVDQDELWKKVKIEDIDIQGYYESNKNKYLKTDSTGKQVPKALEEVKAEISNELQQIKFKEIEKAYIDSLKQKYPVKVYEDALMEAFKS